MNIFNSLLTNGINTVTGNSNNNPQNSPIEYISPIVNSDYLGQYSNYGNMVGGAIPLINTASGSDFISTLTNTASNILNTGNSLMNSGSN